MSQILQCNRCKVTMDASEDQVRETWAELTDAFNNVAQNFPFHLCETCTKDFNVFMETPRPVPA